MFFSTAAAYYAQAKKQENDDNSKAWKILNADEKKPYIQIFNDVSCFLVISMCIYIHIHINLLCESSG